MISPKFEVAHLEEKTYGTSASPIREREKPLWPIKWQLQVNFKKTGKPVLVQKVSKEQRT